MMEAGRGVVDTVDHSMVGLQTGQDDDLDDGGSVNSDELQFLNDSHQEAVDQARISFRAVVPHTTSGQALTLTVVPAGGGRPNKDSVHWRHGNFRVNLVEFVWPHMKFMDPDDPIRAQDKLPAFKLYAKGMVGEGRLREDERELLQVATEIWNNHGGKAVAQVLNKKRSTCIGAIKKSYMGKSQRRAYYGRFPPPVSPNSSGAQLFTERRWPQTSQCLHTPIIRIAGRIWTKAISWSSSGISYCQREERWM